MAVIRNSGVCLGGNVKEWSESDVEEKNVTQGLAVDRHRQDLGNICFSDMEKNKGTSYGFTG